MLINYVVNALIGAFIGLITNYLAIKMLFKPLKPVYIGKLRLPFTPGLIPKEKARIAESIGKTVGNKLLTGDVLEKALGDADIALAVDRLIEETVSGLEKSDYRIRDVLSPIIRGEDGQSPGDVLEEAASKYLKTTIRSEHFKSSLTSFLKTKAQEILTTPMNRLDTAHLTEWVDKGVSALSEWISREGLSEKIALQIEAFIDREYDNQSPLSDHLPERFFVSIKNAVSSHSDRIGSAILGLLDAPQIRKNLMDILDGVMDTSFTTRMINVFVSKDTVYNRIRQKIQKYVESEKGKQELTRAVNEHIDALGTSSVSKVLRFANRNDLHSMTGAVVSFIARDCLDQRFLQSLSKNLKDTISAHPDITLGKLLEPLLKSEADEMKFIDDVAAFILTNWADKAVDGMVRIIIPRLMDLKISSFAAAMRKKPGTSIAGILLPLIRPQAGRIIDALNIPRMVTGKVAEYDIAELEEIILGVISRELRAIVLLGGLFGLIIGLAGPLLSSILS